MSNRELIEAGNELVRLLEITEHKALVADGFLTTEEAQANSAAIRRWEEACEEERTQSLSDFWLCPEHELQELVEAASEYREAVRAWWGDGLSLRAHAASKALDAALAANGVRGRSGLTLQIRPEEIGGKVESRRDNRTEARNATVGRTLAGVHSRWSGAFTSRKVSRERAGAGNVIEFLLGLLAGLAFGVKLGAVWQREFWARWYS